MATDPSFYRQQLRHWRRGGGGESAVLGLALTRAEAADGLEQGCGTVEPLYEVGFAARDAAEAEEGSPSPSPLEPLPSAFEPLSEVAVRELDYSFGGGFDVSVADSSRVDHLGRLRDAPTVVPALFGGLRPHTCALIQVYGSAAPSVAYSLRSSL
eukprot:7388464-Prymnesium_polylepis.2